MKPNAVTSKVHKNQPSPDHSLLFVKSMPRIKFDDSRPASLNEEITCKHKNKSGYIENLFKKCGVRQSNKKVNTQNQ